MFIRNWKKELFTLPNCLSLLRLLLIPVYLHIYIHAVHPRHFHAAGIILALSCITDALDGKIARYFHTESTVGKILDPAADKITQFTLILCLSMRYPGLKPVLCLFIVKELFQLIIGFIHIRHGKILPGALAAGKLCTAVLFVSLILLVLFPDIHTNLVTLIALTDGIFLTVSFVGYFFAYFGKNMLIEDLNPE